MRPFLAPSPSPCPIMVGRSLAMRRVIALVERAATSDASVILEGETGTGKQVAAEAIHRASPRRDRPFVVVDCGAIPRELLESELFGHERGAFSGAVADRAGLFEAANGGTLVLDELGELPLELQPKLLGALERREVRAVGSNRAVPIDVRVIAATNRDLAQEVAAGRFRADLYFRLAVLEIELPPLRERLDDLAELVECLVSRLGVPTPPWMSGKAFLDQLALHPWPGNVRELRNYLERSLALGEPARLSAGAHEPESPTRIDLAVPLRAARDAFERAYLEQSLRHHGGNVSAAARSAGVDRLTFYRLLWRHGLK